METKNLILIEQLSMHHNIDVSFINSLYEVGLVEIIIIEGQNYIQESRLNDLEKMIRLRYDLNINIEGIDAIANLLNQITELQDELNSTKNKLRRYENY